MGKDHFDNALKDYENAIKFAPNIANTYIYIGKFIFLT